MKVRKGLFFLISCLFVLGFANNSLANSDVKFFDKNFKQAVANDVAKHGEDKLVRLGPTAVYKDYLAIFMFVGLDRYGNPSIYFVVTRFNKNEWQPKEIVYPPSLFRKYPEAEPELIQAGYFPK